MRFVVARELFLVPSVGTFFSFFGLAAPESDFFGRPAFLGYGNQSQYTTIIQEAQNNKLVAALKERETYTRWLLINILLIYRLLIINVFLPIVILNL